MNGDPYPHKGRQISRFAASRPGVPTGGPNPKSSEARPRPALPEPGPQSLTAATALGPEWRVPASAERGSDWGAAGPARPCVPRVPGTFPATPCPPPPRPTTYPKRVGAISAAEAAQRHAGGRQNEEPQRRAVGSRHRGAAPPHPAPPRPAPRVGASEATRFPGLGLQASSAAPTPCRFRTPARPRGTPRWVLHTLASSQAILTVQPFPCCGIWGLFLQSQLAG